VIRFSVFEDHSCAHQRKHQMSELGFSQIQPANGSCQWTVKP